MQRMIYWPPQVESNALERYVLASLRGQKYLLASLPHRVGMVQRSQRLADVATAGGKQMAGAQVFFAG